MNKNFLISKHYFNLIYSLDFATKVISQKDHLDILFLDLKKTFGKVPQNRLLLKL